MKLSTTGTLKLSLADVKKIMKSKEGWATGLRYSILDKNYVTRGLNIYIQTFSVPKKLLRK